MTAAAAWYDERVSGLGERFLVEAEAAFARIDEMPLAAVALAPSSSAGWSLANVPTLIPYSAVYILEPRAVIVAVAHLRDGRGTG